MAFQEQRYEKFPLIRQSVFYSIFFDKKNLRLSSRTNGDAHENLRKKIFVFDGVNVQTAKGCNLSATRVNT
jgi:hypothetical protein